MILNGIVMKFPMAGIFYKKGLTLQNLPSALSNSVSYLIFFLKKLVDKRR